MSRPVTPNSTSKGAAGTSAGAAALAPVAAGLHGPVMLFNQKKNPVFHVEKDKDTLTLIGWCNCLDGMKDAMDWSDESTYANDGQRECPEEG